RAPARPRARKAAVVRKLHRPGGQGGARLRKALHRSRWQRERTRSVETSGQRELAASSDVFRRPLRRRRAFSLTAPSWLSWLAGVANLFYAGERAASSRSIAIRSVTPGSQPCWVSSAVIWPRWWVWWLKK